jgi:prepilin-type processing-associated H-X9-DG protein
MRPTEQGYSYPASTLRGDWRGSYGINMWVLRHPDGFRAMELVRFPPRDSGRVPLLADCRVPANYPSNSDDPPKNLLDPEAKGTSPYCMDRHRMAVNGVFLDGHAERVPLAGLWKLKWSELFIPRDVVVSKP